MKSIRLLITGLSLFFSVQLLAQPSPFSNPLIRTCNVTGGVFHVIKLDEDQVGFCQYGKSMIDALTVMDSATARDESAAKLAALGAETDCESAAGEAVATEDLDGAKFNLCVFEDGSIIETETLARGSADADNAALVQALNVKF